MAVLRVFGFMGFRTPAAEQAALDRLNALPDAEAVATFAQCCAARSWATAMAAQRPYRNPDTLYESADRVWRDLGPDAWREAFAGHPRIGEKKSAAAQTPTEARWSSQEQAAAQHADAAVSAELASAQRAYEERFGHIFLICATGLSAAEMLAALRLRMRNDPQAELRVAAEEQRKITRLRLEKLLTS